MGVCKSQRKKMMMKKKKKEQELERERADLNLGEMASGEWETSCGWLESGPTPRVRDWCNISDISPTWEELRD